LELGRVFLLRDAFHVVLPLVVSIVRRLRWKTKFGGQLTQRAARYPSPPPSIQNKHQHKTLDTHFF
ncbi:MAG: hypothetical protein LCH90_23740, partial [Proteobacteria bacterium]|nr:hypothetical protein [Pseudomonadota bacterium]